MQSPNTGDAAAFIAVVIADDHALVRGRLAEIVTTSGTAQIDENYATALATPKTTNVHQPDLLLLNVEMPDVNGDAFYSEIRRWSRMTRICVVTGTGYESPDLRACGRPVGAIGYMSPERRFNLFGKRQILAVLSLRSAGAIETPTKLFTATTDLTRSTLGQE